MKKICKYITYSEAVSSQTAVRRNIDNTPSEQNLINMQLVGIRIFDVVREKQ
jgi:hypothetical protein